MKYSLEAKEYESMAKWRDALIKKTPKENVNEVGAPKTNSKDGLGAKELHKRKKRTHNIVIMT